MMRTQSYINSTVITAYLLILSVSYLWGFWSNFEINILQFINFSDIVKSVIIPMITSLILYFIQTALTKFNTPTSEEIRNFKKKHSLLKTIIVVKVIYLSVLCVISLSGLTYTLIFGSTIQRYVAIGFIISFIVFWKTVDNQSIEKIIPGKNQKYSYAIICFLPILFLSKGVYNAEKIIDGKDTFLIESNSNCTSDPSVRYRFIDNISDKAFALSLKDNSICIFKYDYIKLIKENSNNESG